MSKKTYFKGDKVLYTGDRRPELRNKVGDVCARVLNSETSVVVEFGDEAYVLSASLLRPWVPSKDVGTPVAEVQVKRKRVDPDLE